jgi:hypothetical protein
MGAQNIDHAEPKSHRTCHYPTALTFLLMTQGGAHALGEEPASAELVVASAQIHGLLRETRPT